MLLKDCKSRTPNEALERFEKAVRADEMRGAQDTEDAVLIEEEYEEAKQELLTWMSYIP